MKKRTTFDVIIDALSWAGLIVCWLGGLFLRIVQSYKPGALGIIGGKSGPVAVYFSGNPVYQAVPIIAGTLLFIFFTWLLRKNPHSILAQIYRILRFVFIVAACYLTVRFVI